MLRRPDPQMLHIRSERHLYEKVHLNLSYRWFGRLGLAVDVRVHSTFLKNRQGHFHNSDLLCEVFETRVQRCLAEGLVGGEGFAVDVSPRPNAAWTHAQTDLAVCGTTAAIESKKSAR